MTETTTQTDTDTDRGTRTDTRAAAREALLRHRLCIIYRGLTVDACVSASAALYDAGVRLFEVTFNSGEPERSIEALRERLPGDCSIGAGTVMSAADVRRASDAGAQYIISPHLDPSVIAATHDAGLASIPGAFTPTEIAQAVFAGADLVKVFPLRPVGADYIRQLRGPMPDVALFGSGGVDATLAREATAAGCEAVGVGVQLLGSDPSDTDALATAAREFLDAVGRPAA